MSDTAEQKIVFKGPAGIDIEEKPIPSGFRIRGWSPETGETVEEFVIDTPLSWDPDAFDNLSIDRPSDLEEREIEAVEEARVPYSLGNGFLARFTNCYMKDRTPRGDIEILFKNGGEYAERDQKICSQNVRAVARDAVLGEGLTDEEEEDVVSAFLEAKTAAQTLAEKESSKAEAGEEKEDLSHVDDEEVEEILETGSYLAEVLNRTDAGHVGDYVLKAICAMSATSKPLTNRSLHLWSVGSSGAGKTHCKSTIFRTLPRERKVKFDACSRKALYYFVRLHGEDYLDGKIALFNEVETSEEATDVLRGVTDPDDEEITLITVLDQESLQITIDGSPTVWFTSVDALEDGQLKNRFMFTNPDETTDHKQDIADFQQKAARTGDLQPGRNTDYSVLKKAFRKVVEEGKDKEVYIPFEWEWNRKKDARLQPYFATLIHISALIHQRRRPIVERDDGENAVLATLDDYFLSKFIWNQFEELTLEGLKEKDFEILKEIPDDGDSVTRADLQEKLEVGYQTVRHATDRLSDAGLIKGTKNDSGVLEYVKLKEIAASPASKLIAGSLTNSEVKNFLDTHLGGSARTSGDRGEGGSTPENNALDTITTPSPLLWENFLQTIKEPLEKFFKEQKAVEPAKQYFADLATDIPELNLEKTAVEKDMTAEEHNAEKKPVHENVERSSQDTEEPPSLPTKEQKQELTEVLRKNLDTFPKNGRYIECPLNSCSKEYDAIPEYIEHALAERKKHGAETVVEMWRNAGVELEG